MPIAFKEWAVTVRALAEGEQLLTLRKGGIREPDKHFQLEYDRFFLYPTFDHQRADLVRASHQPELSRALEEGVWSDGEPLLGAFTSGAPVQQPGRGRVDAAAYGVEVPAGLVPWRADVLGKNGSRASDAHAARVAADLNAVHTRGHRLLILSETRPPSTAGLTVWDDGPAPAGPLPCPTAIVCATGAAAGIGRLLGAHVIVPAGA